MSTKRTPKAPRLTIEITDDLIAQATKRDSSHCMIAEAVKVAAPDARHVAVDLATIRFSDPKKGLRYIYLTPRSAQYALIDFDRGAAPVPFSVRLIGGQVQPMGRGSRRGEKPKRAVTDAQRESLRKASLVQRGSSTSNPAVPDRVGGQAPPRGALANGNVPKARRREFGLRALDR